LSDPPRSPQECYPEPPRVLKIKAISRNLSTCGNQLELGTSPLLLLLFPLPPRFCRRDFASCSFSCSGSRTTSWTSSPGVALSLLLRLPLVSRTTNYRPLSVVMRSSVLERPARGGEVLIPPLRTRLNAFPFLPSSKAQGRPFPGRLRPLSVRPSVSPVPFSTRDRYSFSPGLPSAFPFFFFSFFALRRGCLETRAASPGSYSHFQLALHYENPQRTFLLPL